MIFRGLGPGSVLPVFSLAYNLTVEGIPGICFEVSFLYYRLKLTSNLADANVVPRMPPCSGEGRTYCIIKRVASLAAL